MTMKKISAELIKAAQGEFPIDLLLKNAQVINVFSGEIYRENVAIWDKFIVGFGDYEAKKTIDLDGLFLAPGFIDGHVHTESSMVEIPQFARAVVPRGTTSVVCDPHEIANVMGYDGIRYILESSKYNPLNVFIMLPSCVPSTPFETSGSELRAFDLYPFFSEKWVLGLAEVMNYPGLLKCDPELMDKLKISHSKRIDGHAPGLLGKGLSAYVAAGVASDHECTDVEEARAKLRQGLHIMLREGTAAKNLRDLLPLITCENSHRCFFVTDDRHPSDLIEEGHMDHAIRTAIAEGLSPVTAIQMATLNPARYFMLNNHGAIAPGYFADLVAFESLEQIKVRKVFKNGEHVADNGKPCWDPPELRAAQLGQHQVAGGGGVQDQGQGQGRQDPGDRAAGGPAADQGARGGAQGGGRPGGVGPRARPAQALRDRAAPGLGQDGLRLRQGLRPARGRAGRLRGPRRAQRHRRRHQRRGHDGRGDPDQQAGGGGWWWPRAAR